ncbi:MAG: Transcription factor iws1 [Piccolia ochrophora]|nr:MAG: Transcription factor iws1 [Piccolia ochrophora]
MSESSDSPAQSPLSDPAQDGTEVTPIVAADDVDTPDGPAADASPNADDQDDDDLGDSESELSDIDEEQFADFDPANLAIEDRPAIAVDDTNVALIGVHKRKRTDGEGDIGGRKKKKEGKRDKPKKSRKKRDEDDTFSGGEELDGKRERKKKGISDKKERPRARKPSPENEDALSPEERRRRALDRAMDEALKNPNKRRRKKDGEDLEESADALIEDMRQRMVTAAQVDNESRKNGHAAMQKLKLLPDVVALLNRNTLAHALVDPEANLIEAVRFFLEPLSDGSLPAYNIQRDLFSALAKLPITLEALTASGIGKVTLFYTKSKRPEPGIKRMAEKLLAEWSRPILKRSDDFRKRQLASADYDPTKRPLQVATRAPSIAVLRAAAGHAPPERSNNRARVQTGVTSYNIVPRNVAPSQSAYARPVGASGEDAFRRMKARQMGKAGGGIGSRR